MYVRTTYVCMMYIYIYVYIMVCVRIYLFSFLFFSYFFFRSVTTDNRLITRTFGDLACQSFFRRIGERKSRKFEVIGLDGFSFDLIRHARPLQLNMEEKTEK